MKPIHRAWSIVIQLNTFCGRSCLYCSRLDRHLQARDRMNMSLDTLERALASLAAWRKPIGIIGGEPTYHPRFLEVCEILRARVYKPSLHLYTAGGPLYEKHKAEITRTFGYVAYNPHTASQLAVCRHQPMTVASQDAVPDRALREELIEDCWVQRTWCPCIAPWGRAFFCEIAYSWAILLGDRGGFPLTPDWWMRTPEQFREQRERYCQLCGMCVPMERIPLSEKRELVSPTIQAIFDRLGSPRRDERWVKPFTTQFTREDVERNKAGWKPGNFREDKHPDEEAGEQWGSSR